jgi:O-antigen/teichoic acid export membrane protein
LFWLLVGALAVPVAQVAVSLLIDVRLSGAAFVRSAVISVFVTGLILVLLGDFAAFALFGGFVVSAASAFVYVIATSRGLESWRDGSGW